MGEISTTLIFNFLLFLFVPFAFAVLAKKAKISPLIGYIIGGLVLGTVFPELTGIDTVKNIAFFGIVLLLFTVGLETNFTRLFSLRKYILIGGFYQIVLSAAAVFILSILFKFALLESFLIGIALSTSSTTLVAKIIQDRGEESTFIGEIAMGILIFQDLAFIPFLIIFTSITSGTLVPLVVVGNILFSLIKAGFIISALFYIGKKIIPRVFSRIARSSAELFNLFIIIFILFVSGLSLVLDIPVLIGVFIAGILLAQTIEHHQIFSQVRPMRDLLGVIFFVYIGSNIEFNQIIGNLPAILLFTLGVIIVKFTIVSAIFLIMKFHSKTSFSLASYLFQINEGAFILLSSAYLNQVISKDKYLFVITSIIITLILTPIVIKNKDSIYKIIRSFTKKYLGVVDSFIVSRIDSDRSPIDELSIKNHIIICGYGRIGGYIGRSLVMANIPYIAIDYNLYTVEKAKKSGVNIIYGDPTDFNILDYAQADEAAILILAVPDEVTQEEIVLNAKKLNRNIYIIGRVHKKQDQTRLKDLGVDLVVQPEFEASLSIVRRIYLLHKIDKIDMVNKIKRLKLEHGLV